MSRVGFGGGIGFGRGSTRVGAGCSMILGGVMGSGIGGVTGSLGKGGKAGTVGASPPTAGRGGAISSGSSGATSCGMGATMTSSVPSRPVEGERTRSHPHASESTIRAAK